MILMLILTLTPYLVQGDDSIEVPEDPYADVIDSLKDRINNLGRYRLTENMTKEELDAASERIPEESWILVREMEQLMCIIYGCKFYSPCSYDFAEVHNIFDDTLKRQIYSELLPFYEVNLVSSSYEETADYIEQLIPSIFSASRNFFSPGLVVRFDRSLVENSKVVEVIARGLTAKAFLEATFFKTLGQLDSHGRTQQDIESLFGGLVICHCPENYQGKHCETCHKTSTILIAGKDEISVNEFVGRPIGIEFREDIIMKE